MHQAEAVLDYKSASHETGLISTVEQLMDANRAAGIAVRQLIDHLSPLLPEGAPEGIESLLDECEHHHAAEPGSSAIGHLTRVQARKLNTLAGALDAMREAIQL